MRIDKRGTLVDKNLIELILAVAAVFLLIYLLVALFSPSFDENAEIAESYMNTLTEAIEAADSGIPQEFFMVDRGEDSDFYLVYFGEKLSLSSMGVDFIYSRNRGENALCICYSREGDIAECRECIELDSPVEGSGEPWAQPEGEHIQIVKNEGVYKFHADQ